MIIVNHWAGYNTFLKERYHDPVECSINPVVSRENCGKSCWRAKESWWSAGNSTKAHRHHVGRDGDKRTMKRAEHHTTNRKIPLPYNSMTGNRKMSRHRYSFLHLLHFTIHGILFENGPYIMFPVKILSQCRSSYSLKWHRDTTRGLYLPITNSKLN